MSAKSVCFGLSHVVEAKLVEGQFRSDNQLVPSIDGVFVVNVRIGSRYKNILSLIEPVEVIVRCSEQDMKDLLEQKYVLVEDLENVAKMALKALEKSPDEYDRLDETGKFYVRQTIVGIIKSDIYL